MAILGYGHFESLSDRFENLSDRFESLNEHYNEHLSGQSLELITITTDCFTAFAITL